MSPINEFLEYCNKILNANIGYRSKTIIDKARSKKKLNENSDLGDFEEFINLIELDVSVVSGRNNAINICSALRSKAIELNASKQAKDIFNALRIESSELSISEFLKNINVNDVCTFRTKSTEKTNEQIPIKFSINKKIEEFLKRHILPNESIINKFATKLSFKFCEDIKKVKREVIEQVKLSVKNTLIKKAIQNEIRNFLGLFPHPNQNDLEDFVKHIRLSKLDIQEDELRQQILDEILYRKFYKSQDIVEPAELAQFLDIIKTFDNKTDIKKEMQRQGIVYLIEDGSGISYKLLDEYIEPIALIERHFQRK
ncbi:MAG: hypothetical protein Q7J35_18710 [Candidatus Methanoperedens sp.]|nr:hypothetical protein [Candidatus Methanoperedens sp.]